ncbi:DUF1761 domain-containing protein [Bacteroidota bacterium]
MSPVTINYLAVLVCSLLGFGLGALWYGPLFGKPWMKELGKTEDELRKEFDPAKTYTFAFVATFIMILVLAYFISLTGASTIVEGIRVAFTAWTGFTLFTAVLVNLFERNSFKLLFINAFYHLVLLIVGSIILILWV